MGRKKRMLSIDDQKAIDVILDHAAIGASRITRMANAVVPSRVTAATKILSLLDELPKIEPPQDLIAKTMDRIDELDSRQVVHGSHAISVLRSHLH